MNEWSKISRISQVGAVLFVATGCNDPVSVLECPPELNPTMLVEIRELFLGCPIANDASGFIEDGPIRLPLQSSGVTAPDLGTGEAAVR